MLWVTKSTVRPSSRQTRRSSSFRRSRVISSRAPKGSSINRIFGSLASARAIATRWRMPPESSCGYADSLPFRPDQLEQLARRRLGAAGAAHRHLQRQLDVGQRRAPGQERRILEHEADVAAQARGLGRGAEDADLAVVGRDQVGDDAQEGRLAAARRAEQRQELARGDVEAQALQRGDRPPRREEADAQVAAADRQAGAASAFAAGCARGGRTAAAVIVQAFRRAAWVALRMSRVMTSSTFGVLAVNWPSSL